MATLTFTLSFHFSSYSYSHPILIFLLFIFLHLCSSSSIILWSIMSANSSTKGNVTSNCLCYCRRRATIRIARTTRNNRRLFYACPLPQVSNVSISNLATLFSKLIRHCSLKAPKHNLRLCHIAPSHSPQPIP